MAVDEHALARAPAEQLIERHPRRLGLDVPQRGIDRGDRGHRHRPAPPIGPAIEELPHILDPVRVAADQIGDDVIAKRSEEHTSELQSLMRISYAVFCLKKKKSKQQKQ